MGRALFLKALLRTVATHASVFSIFVIPKHGLIKLYKIVKVLQKGRLKIKKVILDRSAKNSHKISISYEIEEIKRNHHEYFSYVSGIIYSFYEFSIT